MEDERQTSKYMSKMTWFKKNEYVEDNSSQERNSQRLHWKQGLHKPWCGNEVTQRPVGGMGFSTLLQVPNTANGELIRRLIGVEFRLAKMSGYNVKLVERSGTQLSRLFQRVFTPPTCHWPECPVCLESDGKKSSKCRLSNIVYEGRCLTCIEMVGEGKQKGEDVGVYIVRVDGLLLKEQASIWQQPIQLMKKASL